MTFGAFETGLKFNVALESSQIRRPSLSEGKLLILAVPSQHSWSLKPSQEVLRPSLEVDRLSWEYTDK